MTDSGSYWVWLAEHVGSCDLMVRAAGVREGQLLPLSDPEAATLPSYRVKLWTRTQLREYIQRYSFPIRAWLRAEIDKPDVAGAPSDNLHESCAVCGYHPTVTKADSGLCFQCFQRRGRDEDQV